MAAAHGVRMQVRRGADCPTLSNVNATASASHFRRVRSKLAIKPKYLEAILFYSQHPDGRPDRAALHGGCPVLKVRGAWGGGGVIAFQRN